MNALIAYLRLTPREVAPPFVVVGASSCTGCRPCGIETPPDMMFSMIAGALRRPAWLLSGEMDDARLTARGEGNEGRLLVRALERRDRLVVDRLAIDPVNEPEGLLVGQERDMDRGGVLDVALVDHHVLGRVGEHDVNDPAQIPR